MTMAPLHPDVIEFLDDQSLLEAYQQMASEERNLFVDHLLAEIQRRNLEI